MSTDFFSNTIIMRSSILMHKIVNIGHLKGVYIKKYTMLALKEMWSIGLCLFTIIYHSFPSGLKQATMSQVQGRKGKATGMCNMRCKTW